jgi:molybdopterin molybdotransferase
VFVTFCLIARPFLLRCQGAREPGPPRLTVTARFSVRKPGSRQEYLRVNLSSGDAGVEATAYPNQSSGVLSSVSASNALAIIPPGTTVEEGDAVEVLLLDLLTG